DVGHYEQADRTCERHHLRAVCERTPLPKSQQEGDDRNRREKGDIGPREPTPGDKSSEITAIPALVERLDLEGALVSIDAMGCNANIAQSILDAKAAYLLAVKDNQPSLHADIESYFETARPARLSRLRRSARIMAASRSAPYRLPRCRLVRPSAQLPGRAPL